MLSISVFRTLQLQTLPKGQMRFGTENGANTVSQDRYISQQGEGKKKTEHRSQAYDRLIGALPGSNEIPKAKFELFKRIKFKKEAENDRLIAEGQREW